MNCGSYGEHCNDQTQLKSPVDIVQPQNCPIKLSSRELLPCPTKFNLNAEPMGEPTPIKSETHIPRIKVKPLRELQESYMPEVTATVESEYLESDDCLLEFLNLPPHLLTKHLEGITLNYVSNESLLKESQQCLVIDSQQLMLDNSMQLSVNNKKGSACGVLERIFQKSEESTIWTCSENASESATDYFSPSVFVETEDLSVDFNLPTTESENVENYSYLTFDRFYSDTKLCENNDQENIEGFEDTEVIDLPKSLDNVDVNNVDMTGLKDGIIDASRTLINTQKMLKFLSKVISKQAMLKHHQILTALTEFKKILKLFQGKISKIDKTVNNQYKDLFPKSDIDFLLESIKKSMPEKSTKLKMKKRKKIDSITSGLATGKRSEKSTRRRRNPINPEQ